MAPKVSSIISLLVYCLLAYAALANQIASPYDRSGAHLFHIRAGGGPGGGGGARPPPGTGRTPGTPGRQPGAKVPRIDLVDLPPSAGLKDAESKPFAIGNYRNKPNDERVLFNSFQGPDRAFFLKMMDIFSTTDGYYKNSDENVYQELPSNDRPFQPQDRPRGEKIDIRPDMKSKKGDNNPEIKFDPKPAESACGVFLSVYTYCLDGTDVDMDCACYSSTYYVPDQFNGLATRCAKATSGCRSGNNNNRGGDDWCDVGSKVASYSAYCTPIDDDKPVKFGVTIDASSTKASGPKPTPRETEDDDSPAPARQTTPSTPRTTRTSQTDAAAPVTITPAPTPAILQPPRSSAVVIFPSTTGRASRPLDVLLGSARLWGAFALSAAVAFN